MFDNDGWVATIRQGMRIRDRTGLTVGYVREVSGHSVLVAELFGRRVFWLHGDRVDGVVDGEVRLRTAHRVAAPPTDGLSGDRGPSPPTGD